MSGPKTVAFQGEPGAFSHEACLEFLPGFQPVPHLTFHDAIEAVRTGRCDAAMIPTENSTAGPVPEVEALAGRSGLETVAEHYYRIRLQLLACPGAELKLIEAASSHPMALAQCRATLRRLGLRAEAAYDTAGAAAALARTGDHRRAAIASRTAAEIHGLQVLMADVEDSSSNTTRFIVLRRPA